MSASASLGTTTTVTALIGVSRAYAERQTRRFGIGRVPVYARSMVTAAAVGKVAEATDERLSGGRVSRLKALLASAVVGAGAAVATYRLLRSGDEN